MAAGAYQGYFKLGTAVLISVDAAIIACDKAGWDAPLLAAMAEIAELQALPQVQRLLATPSGWHACSPCLSFFKMCKRSLVKVLVCSAGYRASAREQQQGLRPLCDGVGIMSRADAAPLAHQEQGQQQRFSPGNAAVLPPVRTAQQAAGVAIARSGTPVSSSTSGDLQPQQWGAAPGGSSREARSDSTSSDDSATAKRVNWQRQVQAAMRLAQSSAPAKRCSAAATAGTKRKRELGANPVRQAWHGRPGQHGI